MQSEQFENQLTEHVLACHECDLLMRYPNIEVGSVAICPRCNYVLTKHHQNAKERLLAYAVSALVFLVMSSLFPFISFSAGGHERVVTLLQSLDVLANQQQILLALLIMIVILIIPAVFLVGVLYVIGALKYQSSLPPQGRRLLLFILALAPWSMVEIFLIGTMVSLVKIASMATISLGISFWAYIAFTVLMTLVLLHLDKVQVWSWVEESEHQATV